MKEVGHWNENERITRDDEDLERYEDDILLLLLLSNDALLLPLAVSSEVISVHEYYLLSEAMPFVTTTTSIIS